MVAVWFARKLVWVIALAGDIFFRKAVRVDHCPEPGIDELPLVFYSLATWDVIAQQLVRRQKLLVHVS